LIFSGLKRLVVSYVNEWRASIVHWTKPLSSSLPLGTLADLGRSKAELIAENALEELPKKPFGRLCVASTLHQDIQHVAI
jgi:hypothetical protein